MLNDSDELIEIRPSPSRYMAWLGGVAHGVAVLAPWFSSLFFPFQLFATVLVAVHACHFFYRHVLMLSRHSIVGLRFYQNQWLVQTSYGWYRVWPVGSQLVTPWLMVFRFRCDPDSDQPGNHSLCLWSDSDDVRVLHALRLRLLLQVPELDSNNKYNKW